MRVSKSTFKSHQIHKICKTLTKFALRKQKMLNYVFKEFSRSWCTLYSAIYKIIYLSNREHPKYYPKIILSHSFRNASDILNKPSITKPSVNYPRKPAPVSWNHTFTRLSTESTPLSFPSRPQSPPQLLPGFVI